MIMRKSSAVHVFRPFWDLWRRKVTGDTSDVRCNLSKSNRLCWRIKPGWISFQVLFPTSRGVRELGEIFFDVIVPRIRFLEFRTGGKKGTYQAIAPFSFNIHNLSVVKSLLQEEMRKIVFSSIFLRFSGSVSLVFAVP